MLICLYKIPGPNDKKMTSNLGEITFIVIMGAEAAVLRDK